MIDLSLLRSADSETYRFRPGWKAPKFVCASTSRVHGTAAGRQIVGELVEQRNVLAMWRELLTPLPDGRRYTIALANGPYDLAVAAEHDPSLLKPIFDAIRSGHVHDILTAEGLDAIYWGHHGQNADFTQMRKPSTGEVTNRYSLEIVVKNVLGRVDAKKNDVWRESYALLDGIPIERWPLEARVYPVDDGNNTLEAAVGQLFGVAGTGDHYFVEVQAQYGTTFACKYCATPWDVIAAQLETVARVPCKLAPPTPHKNLNNLAAQVEADFCLHLGNAHSLRVDPEQLDKLEAEMEAKNKVAVERFQKLGWIRTGQHSWKKEAAVHRCARCGTTAIEPTNTRCTADPDDGSEDTAAVKRALVAAYGATVPCRRCGGTGKVRNAKQEPCRGPKVKNRYAGCIGDARCVCHGQGKVWKYGNEVTCKYVFAEDGETVIETGCDGSGFDLDSVPLLPRTEKHGVKTDRDAKMESGNDDLSDYGEDEFAKALSTYIPYLRTGVDAPLELNPDALKASGRCSYGTIHQFPRKGGLRECIRARGLWCGCIECVLASTDYSAGELCALSQVTYWYEGESKMLELINATKDPGSLHTMTAAIMLNTTLEDVKARIAAGDQQAKDYRQAAKPASFGFPGGLGAPTLVVTNRRKNAGMTTGPDGTEYAGIRFCILIGGAERCGVEKVIEWNRRPCPPVCKKCVQIVEDILKPSFFKLYPEVKRYLDRISAMVREGKHIPAPAWNAARGCVEVLRLRGRCGYTDGANQGFQGLLADIGKRAYCRMTREAYLGVKDDGSPSPLAGVRFPVFMHDEPLAEGRADTAHIWAPRIGEIMEESGRELAPDVYWEAKPALMERWFKEAAPVTDATGKLIPWRPKAKVVVPAAVVASVAA